MIKGHSFTKRNGFTGSAGQIPVKPYMRRPPKAGNLAITRDSMPKQSPRPNLIERARRPGGMNRGGAVCKKNW